MVSLPAENMPLSIGPFPNWLPIGPCPPLYDTSVSRTKVLWGSLDSFRLLLLSGISKLLVGPPVTLDFPVMNWQTRTPKPEQHFPLSMFPAHWPRWLQKLGTPAILWDEISSHNSLFCRFLRFLCRMALPRLARCKLSRLRCHGHSLLLSSYLCRMKLKQNSSCSACGHQLQDLTLLLLDSPASEPLRRAIFGITSSIFDLWPDLGAWPDCWVSVEFLHDPIARKGSGSITTSFVIKRNSSVGHCFDNFWKIYFVSLIDELWVNLDLGHFAPTGCDRCGSLARLIFQHSRVEFCFDIFWVRYICW